MQDVKPSGAPDACWGKKYQDGEEECIQCSYKDTCKISMMNRVIGSQPVPTNSLPISRTPLPVIQPSSSLVPTRANVPIPSRSIFSGISAPSPAPVINPTPSAAKPPTYTPPSYSQPSHSSYSYSNSNYSLHNLTNPNPLAPIHRPGAQGPAYYPTHYPGESVALRIVKNVVLRALEAIFYELAQFFKHWTWPTIR